MRAVRFIVAGTVLLANLVAPQALLAQVPPHTPGTVCLTPTFWCSIGPKPYPVGAPCFCKTRDGNVPGTIG